MSFLHLPLNMKLPNFVRDDDTWKVKVENSSLYTRHTTCSWGWSCLGSERIDSDHHTMDFFKYLEQAIRAYNPVDRALAVVSMRETLKTLRELASIEAMRTFMEGRTNGWTDSSR